MKGEKLERIFLVTVIMFILNFTAFKKQLSPVDFIFIVV